MIFPGQGAQFVGMGKELYDQERLVQEYFEQASICLKKNFVKLCFASSERQLMETENAQTSIFLVSACIYQLLKEKYGITPDLVAGHSLGEYSALFAAGGLSFSDALYLLNKRAQFMEEATRDQNGSMLAVLNFSPELLRDIISRYDDDSDLRHVAQIVNYNSATQLVVSGTLPELEEIKKEVIAQGGRAIMLKVSGGFHSRLMKKAQDRFAAYLTKVDVHDLSTDLINNVEARKVSSVDEVKSSLVEQISAPVLWSKSMEHFKDCDLIVQIGPNTVYSKMLQRQWPDKTILSVNNQDDIDVLHSYVGRAVPRQVGEAQASV